MWHTRSLALNPSYRPGHPNYNPSHLTLPFTFPVISWSWLQSRSFRDPTYSPGHSVVAVIPKKAYLIRPFKFISVFAIRLFPNCVDFYSFKVIFFHIQICDNKYILTSAHWPYVGMRSPKSVEANSYVVGYEQISKEESTQCLRTNDAYLPEKCVRI